MLISAAVGRGGMPVKKEEAQGVTKPTAAAKTGETKKPATKIGRCMGKKTLPNPMMWNRMGRTIPRAPNKEATRTS
jgi:hypothetical protein